MTSGAHRVDTDLVAALVGASAVLRADARSVREWTGQAIGGVAPVGHPAPIRTLVDTWLDKYDVVWAAAAHPHTVFPTSFAELIRITGGTPADVGRLVSADKPPGSVVQERPVVRLAPGCVSRFPGRIQPRDWPRGSRQTGYRRG
jgi:hypothetical protein